MCDLNGHMNVTFYTKIFEELKMIMDKSKCQDLFQGTVVKGMNLY